MRLRKIRYCAGKLWLELNVTHEIVISKIPEMAAAAKTLWFRMFSCEGQEQICLYYNTWLEEVSVAPNAVYVYIHTYMYRILTENI